MQSLIAAAEGFDAPQTHSGEPRLSGIIYTLYYAIRQVFVKTAVIIRGKSPFSPSALQRLYDGKIGVSSVQRLS